MNRGLWKGLLIVCIVMLLILAASLTVVPRSSPTHVVVILGAVNLGIVMAIVSALLYFDWTPFDELM